MNETTNPGSVQPPPNDMHSLRREQALLNLGPLNSGRWGEARHCKKEMLQFPPLREIYPRSELTTENLPERFQLTPPC